MVFHFRRIRLIVKNHVPLKIYDRDSVPRLYFRKIWQQRKIVAFVLQLRKNLVLKIPVKRVDENHRADKIDRNAN